MRSLLIIITLLYLPNVLALQSASFEMDPLQGRINTMECSEQEVLAYVIPKDKTRLSPDYETYKKAHAQTAIFGDAVTQAETCLGALYGDMGELSDQLISATNAMFTTLSSQAAMEALLSQAFDELIGSVCGALSSGAQMAHTAIVQSVNDLHEKVLDEVNGLVGQAALAEYVDEYLVDQDPMGLNLRYRQRGISNDMVVNQLNSTLKRRWKNRLRELNKELPR